MKLKNEMHSLVWKREKCEIKDLDKEFVKTSIEDYVKTKHATQSFTSPNAIKGF